MKVQQQFIPMGNLPQKIEFLERRDLENAVFPSLDLAHYLTTQNLIQVIGISRFWEDFKGEKKFHFEQYMEDFVTGLYGAKIPFAFLIIGEKDIVQLFMGVPNTVNKGDTLLKNLLIASFPDIRIRDEKDISYIVQSLSKLSLSGAITGIPTVKSVSKDTKRGVEQIERLIRGLFGERWAYLVAAEPLRMDIVTNAFAGIAEEIRSIKNTFLLKGTVDEANRLAQAYVELLESALEKFKTGKSQGMWQVRTQFLAHRPHVLNIGLSLLKSVFSGDESLPQPIRAHRCQQDPIASSQQKNTIPFTILNSRDLSVFVQLPKEEMPGYTVQDYARFDVSLPEKSTRHPVAIGAVVDRGVSTGTWYEMELNDLIKHGLIVGTTGSGKTNTCFYILEQLWKQYKIPFLVIEPAKSEYRDLAGVKGFDDLQVFTLGDETVAPFRLNPFEVQPGFLVQSHIDYLKSVFNASFILYAPMPYILEQSIYEIYQDRGWDLAKNENQRGKGSLSYPTMTDLYYKVAEVTERAGWEHRMKLDVQASLRARINSLRIGSKGLMLDTHKSVKIEHLLSKPTVLELQQIGDDEEKAFMMGLIMTRIYEYYRTQTGLGKIQKGIHHLTLIEEAHRLLKNVPTEKIGEESANPKGKAVETFCNILSEIRAYGEGILIAEQIPTKLALDAIKNTNLKIMHRIVASEDREVMSGTMNLDEDCERYITTLETGKAVVYAEGADKPYLIQVPNYKGNFIKKRFNDTEIAQRERQRFYKKFQGIFMHFAGCSECKARKDCGALRDIAKEIVDDDEFTKAFNKFFISTVINADFLTQGYSGMLRELRRIASPKNPDEERNIAYCVMLHAIDKSVEDRGRLYIWSYNDMISLQQILQDIIKTLVFSFQKVDSKKIKEWLKDNVKRFQNAYRNLCKRTRGPYPACSLCKNICLYRYDAELLLRDRFTDENFHSIFKEGTWDEILSKAGTYSAIASGKVVLSKDENTLKQVGLCYAAQKAASQHFDITDQIQLGKNVLAAKIYKRG